MHAHLRIKSQSAAGAAIRYCTLEVRAATQRRLQQSHRIRADRATNPQKFDHIEPALFSLTGAHLVTALLCYDLMDV
jgi:hypothetical protein